ncbi:MAG: phosphopantetheine adenylyltransferase [Desulfuromonas sp. SDB]|nr:MAG: phosphopantetheine adenylyltransferase [Desulfuromonas sp. SDB]
MKAIKAVYPGTFDPVTFGHMDIAVRAAKLFQDLTILVAVHPSKKAMFSSAQRVEFLKQSLQDVSGIKVREYHGLLAKYVEEHRINTIIRGLRAVSDFEYELSLALMNRRMNNDLETIFLTPREDLLYLNSTMVKQVAALGGDVSQWVPPVVSQAFTLMYQ